MRTITDALKSLNNADLSKVKSHLDQLRDKIDATIQLATSSKIEDKVQEKLLQDLIKILSDGQRRGINS